MERTISGLHAIEEALRRGGISGTLLIEKENSRIERLAGLARKRGCSVKKVSHRELAEASSAEGVRDAVLIVTREEHKANDLSDFIEKVKSENRQSSLVLVLDGITDPHNVGAVLRSSDLCGVDLVVIPSRRSARINETVQRTSAGAVSYVPVVVETNVRRVIGALKDEGYWAFAADVDGKADRKSVV
mgnify:CR=1 FL=1